MLWFVILYWLFIGNHSAIPEKNKQGGVKDILGYWRNSKCIFQGLKIKNKVEFPGMTKKKSCDISRVLGFKP